MSVTDRLSRILLILAFVVTFSLYGTRRACAVRLAQRLVETTPTLEAAIYDNATTLSGRMFLRELYFKSPAMVHAESPGSAPVHSARFATIPSGRRVFAETEAAQTLVVSELQ